MSVNATGTGGVVPRLGNTPGQTTPTQPGFDRTGAPLADDQVWGIEIGRDRRPLNTADAHTGQKIDGWEQNHLLNLAKADPKAFLSRLLADSMNGTPVEFGIKTEIGGRRGSGIPAFGLLKVGFKMENGTFNLKLDFDVYNKAVDRWLSPYMAKDGREKGTRSNITVSMTGDVQPDQSIQNVQFDAGASKIPKLSADKLVEIDRFRKRLNSALKEKSKADRDDGVKNVFEDAIRRVTSFPVHFFMDLIADSDDLVIDIKEKDDPTAARAELDDGNYKITFTDLLGDEDQSTPEAKVGAQLSGKVDDNQGTIDIDNLRVYNEHPISVEWEGNRPVAYRTDPKTNEKTRIDEHANELLRYLPLAFAFAAGRGDI